MRLLHTADWHLCDMLGTICRQDDLEARVTSVARLCDEHAVDVLLVAGDLFYERARADDVVTALRHINKSFESFFVRGGIILAITGNHDRDSIIDPVREGMNLASPLPSQGRLQPGRMYLQSGRGVATLTKAGETVQFVLVPWPNAHRYGEEGDRFTTREEHNRAYMNRIAVYLGTLKSEQRIDVRHPSVLLAHLSLPGLQIQGRHRPTEADTPILHDVSLLHQFAYVALGDIHEPKLFQNNPRIRYSGSLDRLDFGEKHNDCGVVLVDIGPTGVKEEPRWLSIPATPMLEIPIADPDLQLPELAKHPERETAIVKINVAPGNYAREDVQQRLRRIFKRVYDISFDRPDAPPSEDTGELMPRKSYQETVREYLTQELAKDDDRVAVMELAEQYLQEAAQ